MMSDGPGLAIALLEWGQAALPGDSYLAPFWFWPSRDYDMLPKKNYIKCKRNYID